MIEFITGSLFVGVLYNIFTSIRLLHQIEKLKSTNEELKQNISSICQDVNMVEHTLNNRIDTIDQNHTQVEEDIKQIISGSMKSSNKRLLKG
jgi:hypothetical protein